MKKAVVATATGWCALVLAAGPAFAQGQAECVSMAVKASSGRLILCETMRTDADRWSNPTKCADEQWPTFGVVYNMCLIE